MKKLLLVFLLCFSFIASAETYYQNTHNFTVVVPQANGKPIDIPPGKFVGGTYYADYVAAGVLSNYVGIPAPGDIIYTYLVVPISDTILPDQTAANGKFLKSVLGTATWADVPSGLAGTLVSGRVPYANGASTVTDKAVFTFDPATDTLTVGTLRGKVPGVGGTVKVCASNALATAGCDFVATGTADQTVINAAIQAAPAAGGKVVLSDGLFTISAAIVGKSGVWLQGAGMAATTIQVVTGHAGSIDLVALRANGANSNITISDLTLDANGAPTVQGVYVSSSPDGTYADNVRIERCVIKGGTGTSYGIMSFGATNLLISDNIVSDWGDSVIELKASRQVKIVRNSLLRGTVQFYAQVDGNSNAPRDYVFANNTIRDGNVVFTDAGSIVQGFVFTGNVWTDSDDVAANAQALFRRVNNLTVTGNVFDSSLDTTFTLATVVIEATATNVVFADNVIRTGTGSAGAYGYDGLELASPGALVANNQFIIPGDYNDGIKITAATTGARIVGNRFVGSSGVNGSAIDMANAVNVTLDGNICDTFGGTALKVAATCSGTRIFDTRFLGTVAVPYGILDTTALLRDLSGIAFASLPADVADGSLVYCSDGTIASPVAGGGTGCLAKRLNNTWVGN